MRWEAFLLNPAVVWVLIPISVILVQGISAIYERYCLHQERLAMIENGIHPDEADSELAAEPHRSSVPKETAVWTNPNIE